MNEFFLISITLLTALIKGNDKAPALVYALAAHVFWLISLWSNSVASLFLAGAISDLLVILLLVCLGGCLRSRITYFLIPLSVLSMCLHFWGWSIYKSGADYGFFNSLVMFYMCVIIALFAFAAGGYGNIGFNNRLLDRNNPGPNHMAKVFR